MNNLYFNIIPKRMVAIDYPPNCFRNPKYSNFISSLCIIILASLISLLINSFLWRSLNPKIIYENHYFYWFSFTFSNPLIHLSKHPLLQCSITMNELLPSSKYSTRFTKKREFIYFISVISSFNNSIYFGSKLFLSITVTETSICGDMFNYLAK